MVGEKLKWLIWQKTRDRAIDLFVIDPAAAGITECVFSWAGCLFVKYYNLANKCTSAAAFGIMEKMWTHISITSNLQYEMNSSINHHKTYGERFCSLNSILVAFDSSRFLKVIVVVKKKVDKVKKIKIHCTTPNKW